MYNFEGWDKVDEEICSLKSAKNYIHKTRKIDWLCLGLNMQHIKYIKRICWNLLRKTREIKVL